MAEIKKCPLCGTKLKMINGSMTCKECGYRVRNQDEQISVSSEIQNSTSSDAFKQIDNMEINIDENTQAQQNKASKNKTFNTSDSSLKPKYPSKIVAAAGVIATIILYTAITLFQRGVFDSLFGGKGGKDNNSGRLMENTYLPEVTIKPSPTVSSSKNETKADKPQSGFFQEVAEAIWGKPYQNITEKEYASLTAIEIDRSNKIIYYQLNHGNSQTLSYISDSGKKLSDLSVFSGLEWIMIDESLSKGDLKGLSNLWGVYTDNTIEEYKNIISEPENIFELGIKDSIFKDSLAGIEDFPNLEYLSVDYGSLKDISALLELPNLYGLSLVGCDRLTDYSPLMSLTNLESLKIESSQLKSIDFIRSMPKLSSLAIEDSSIVDLDALASCPELTRLSLIGNNYIEDYSAVGELELLYDLTLKMSYGSDLPSFEKLTQLETLQIKYAGDLSPLKHASNVSYLSLERCSGWELEVLSSMTELTTLVIHDFLSYVDSLAPLTSLPNLQTLDLSDTFVFGNIEEIFGIPTLRYLWLDDCQIGLDFEKLPENETLEYLSMDKIRILNDPTYNNGDTIMLSDHYDLFANFPNLISLSLISTQIDSIAFVEVLPRLQYLDITDNNVTSLKPLESLNDFRTVWCGKNTILENLSENSSITVITTDK